MTEPPPSAVPPESERVLTAVEAWFHHRIEHAPRRIAALDLALHRHCAECGLPVLKYTPGGTVYDLGVNEEHVCPPDFGREARCLCGVVVRESITGRVTEGTTGRAHDCAYTADLGHHFALLPSPVLDRLVRAHAQAEAAAQAEDDAGKGVLPLP